MPARVAGVLLRPTRTMQEVVARPHWLGMWIVVLAIWAVCATVLLSTEVGQQALVDERVRVTEAFGGTVDDGTYAGLQANPPWPVYLASGGRLLLTPPMTVLVALAIWGAARLLRQARSNAQGQVRGADLAGPPARVVGASGWLYGPPAAETGRATLTQAMAIAVHASVPLALGQMMATPIHFVRESLTSPLTLANLVPLVEEGTVAARVFGAVDLFSLWWACLLGVGVAILAQRPARTVLAGVFATYASVALILGVAQALSGGE